MISATENPAPTLRAAFACDDHRWRRYRLETSSRVRPLGICHSSRPAT